MHPTEQDRSARVAMITLAERLFAEQGIESVPMRQVAIGAGQRNNSAVSYHFGSREGLVRAVLEHRSGPIDARRCELIEGLEEVVRAGNRGPSLAEVTRVFVQPLAEAIAADEPTWYLRFLADATVDPSRDETQHGTPPPGVRWVNEQLAALIDAPRAVLRRRLRWMVLITLRVLADHERAAAAAHEARATNGAVTSNEAVAASEAVTSGQRAGGISRAELVDVVDDLTRTLTALLATD